MIRPFQGHEGSIDHVFVDTSDQRLVSFGRDRTARLWDLSTGDEIRKITWRTEDSGYSPTNVARVGDDAMLVREGIWGNPNYWHLDFNLNRQPVSNTLDSVLRGHGSLGESTVANASGSLIVVPRGDELGLHDTNNGSLLRTLAMNSSQHYCTRFCSNDRHIVSLCKDASIRIRDVSTNRQIASFTLPTEANRLLAVSDNSRFLVTGDRGRYSDKVKTFVGLGDYSVEVWRMPLTDG